MADLSRRLTPEEEFANLKEKESFVCARYHHPLPRDWQMRKPPKWPPVKRMIKNAKRQIMNDKPLYCFAICHRPCPWILRDEYYLCSYEDALKARASFFIFKIFILVPENCSLYHFANFIASTDGIACVAAGSKIYLFGGGCGTSVWYMDVVVGKRDTHGKEWKQAKECLNREKHHPLSFSLGNKIYALETLYLPTSNDEMTEQQIGKVDDDYCFEVLDTSTHGSCWGSLPNPPSPFGGCTITASWSDDQNDDSRIFIEGCFDSTKYLFVYDVVLGTWEKFERVCAGDSPFYTWALHLAGKDFAPFPPHVPYTGDLRVLTGLKRSIPQQQQVLSECQEGISLPFAVTVETDRKEEVTVLCQNSSRHLTGWDLESLWTSHCLPVECMIFWQAIHLGGSSFCTLAFYLHSSCCTTHTNLYARVANFDITETAAGGASERVFSAEYGPNKVYLVSKDCDVSPLACSKLQPI